MGKIGAVAGPVPTVDRELPDSCLGFLVERTKGIGKRYWMQIEKRNPNFSSQLPICSTKIVRDLC